MAVVVSGGFLISDRTGIENFIKEQTNTVSSGASIFAFPDHENRKVTIGVASV